MLILLYINQKKLNLTKTLIINIQSRRFVSNLGPQNNVVSSIIWEFMKCTLIVEKRCMKP